MSQSYYRCKITILVRSFNPVILHDCLSSLCCLPSLGTVSRQKKCIISGIARIIYILCKQIPERYCSQLLLANLVTGTAELVIIFFVNYLGPGKPSSKSERAQEEVGPKKVREMDFCQNCFHISGPQSAR